MPWVRPLAAAVCAASHAAISAWPRGNAATLALALRQSVCADSTPPLCASAWWVGATTPTSGSAAGTAWGVELADPSGAEPCAASANGAAARVAINRRDRVCAGRMGISKNKGLCSGSCRSATHHQHVTCKQRRSGCGGGQVLRAGVRHNASHGSHRNTWGYQVRSGRLPSNALEQRLRVSERTRRPHGGAVVLRRWAVCGQARQRRCQSARHRGGAARWADSGPWGRTGRG